MLCLVAQLCPSLCNLMDCSPPGYSAHGDSPGKTTQVGCHALLQGNFPTQGSNPCFPHCRRILYQVSHKLNNNCNPWTAALQAPLSFTISQSLLKLMPTDSVMPSHHIIHCHPYLLPFLLLPSIFPYLMVFSVSQLFASGGRSIGSSAFASVLPMNIQD